jgi:hypothetical protein
MRGNFTMYALREWSKGTRVLREHYRPAGTKHYEEFALGLRIALAMIELRRSFLWLWRH